jgi:hypothetical protein
LSRPERRFAWLLRGWTLGSRLLLRPGRRNQTRHQPAAILHLLRMFHVKHLPHLLRPAGETPFAFLSRTATALRRHARRLHHVPPPCAAEYGQGQISRNSLIVRRAHKRLFHVKPLRQPGFHQQTASWHVRQTGLQLPTTNPGEVLGIVPNWSTVRLVGDTILGRRRPGGSGLTPEVTLASRVFL